MEITATYPGSDKPFVFTTEDAGFIADAVRTLLSIKGSDAAGHKVSILIEAEV